MKSIKIMQKLGLFLTIVSMVLWYGCSHPQPIEYEYTELLPYGWRDVSVVGINNKGEVVGKGVDSNGARKAFIYSNGEFTELRAPEGWDDFVDAIAINNNGDVLGNGYVGCDPNCVSKCFIYSNGNYTEILPRWSYARARDMNDKGEVIGDGEDSNGVGKVFLYSNGQYKEILPPRLEGGFRADAINNNSEVAGVAQNANGVEKVFIYSQGKYVILPKPLGYRNDYTNTKIKDINDNGDFILWVDVTGGKGFWKSFIYSNGRYKELRPPGGEDCVNCFLAEAINNYGEVIATDEHGGTFIYYGGKYMEVTQPTGWDYVIAIDLNDYGEITGNLESFDSIDKGFIAVPK
jgi:probable HAF family extracellular repeat protein